MQPLTGSGSFPTAVSDDFFDPGNSSGFTSREPIGEEVRQTAEPARQSVLQRWSELASRLGFILSFIFLLLVGAYAASLSGRAGLDADSVSRFADEAAGAAGLAVKNVSIEGLVNMPESDVHMVLSGLQHRSIAFFDTEAARKGLLQLGWVENAQIRRTLPDQLHIFITERPPYARWRSAGEQVSVIDREGRILGPAAGRFDDFPLLAGEGARAEAASIVPLLSAREHLFDRVASAKLIAGRYWELQLRDGLRIKLRRIPDESVLDRVARVLGNRDVSGKHVAALDFRLDSRIVVELKDKSVAAREKLVALLSRANEPIALPARKGGA